MLTLNQEEGEIVRRALQAMSRQDGHLEPSAMQLLHKVGLSPVPMERPVTEPWEQEARELVRAHRDAIERLRKATESFAEYEERWDAIRGLEAVQTRAGLTPIGTLSRALDEIDRLRAGWEGAVACQE